MNLSYRELWAINKIFEYFGNIFSSFSLKGFFSSVMAIIELLQMLIFSYPTTPRGPQLDLTGYEVAFVDEFEAESLDLSVWDIRGNGPRRGGYNASSQVSVRNGNLVLTGEYLENGEYGDGWYAAAVKLKERYKEGYFEIKCICNDAPVFWSAFWIQADAPYTAEISKGGIGGAEIDIIETIGHGEKNSHNSVTHTIHCAGVDGEPEGFQSANLGKFYGNNIYKEYNTYGMMWNEDEYIFYVNGVETVRSSFGNGTSQVEEDVIVSLEFPDEEKLSTLDKETYKTEFIVDYVKIYQKK